MTAQINDTYRYLGKEYSLIARDAPMGFDPRSYGFHPVCILTACWRGYWCEYEVEENCLFLKQLFIANKNDDYPDFNGTQVEPLEYVEWKSPISRDRDGNLIYETISMPANAGHRNYKVKIFMPYTGTIVMGDGFMREYYKHDDFQRAWEYREVKELKFLKGELQTVTDHSAFVAELRRIAGDDPPLFNQVTHFQIPEQNDNPFSSDLKDKFWWFAEEEFEVPSFLKR